MSAPVTNQAHTRPKIFSGSPKKKAAWRSFSNRNGGSRPGAVSTCHSTKIATSRPSCQARRLPGRGLMNFHMASGGQLLLIALDDLVAQHRPDRLVQLDEARRGAHLGDVARALEVDAELADRVRARPGAQAHHAVAHR